VLRLSANPLGGSIPAELANLAHLQALELSFAELSGPIPPELGGLSDLVNLTLFVNELTGSIPAELGSLTGLLSLNLSGNQLTGPIPSELGNLAHLQLLWLSDNELTGPIPPELSNLGDAFSLLLAGNLLSGQVPLSVAERGGQIEDLSGQCSFSDNPWFFMPNTAAYMAADLDHDGFICAIAIGGDADSDGIPDAIDPDLLADLLETIPDAAFKSGDGGHRNAMQSRLADIEQDILDGDVDQAIRALENLKRKVDGCGATADRNDWILDCPSQVLVRDLIDTLIAGLGG